MGKRPGLKYAALQRLDALTAVHSLLHRFFSLSPFQSTTFWRS